MNLILTRTKALLLTCALALSGCAAVDKVSNTWGEVKAGYLSATRPVTEPPATQPHALLRVSTRGQVRLFPGQVCPQLDEPRSGMAAIAPGVSPLSNSELNGQKRGMPGQAPAGFATSELRVVADEPITALFEETVKDGSGWAWSCRQAWSFVLRPGDQLQFVSKLVWEKPVRCDVTLNEVGSGVGRLMVPAPLKCP